jgi:hypothetical protein
MREIGLFEPRSEPGRSGNPLKWIFYLVVVLLGLFLLEPEWIEFFVKPRVMAGEQSAIQSVTIIKIAQETYKRELGGFAPTIDCLVRPVSCTPTYRGGGFLHEDYAGQARNGYVFGLVASPRDPAQAAVSYAVFANPIDPGKTGVRSFCADSAGRLCFGHEEMRPGATAACPAACKHDISL